MIVFICFGKIHIEQTHAYTNFPRAEIHAVGHASDAIAECYHVAAGFLSDYGRWHFVKIQCISPMERGLGDNHDSAWVVKAWAQVKSQ